MEKFGIRPENDSWPIFSYIIDGIVLALLDLFAQQFNRYDDVKNVSLYKYMSESYARRPNFNATEICLKKNTSFHRPDTSLVCYIKYCTRLLDDKMR